MRSESRALHIVEANVPMDEVADRLDALPAGLESAEQRPAKILKLAIDLAVPAGQQEQQDIMRQILHFLLRRVGNLQVGQPAVINDRLVAKQHAHRLARRRGRSGSRNSPCIPKSATRDATPTARAF